ncbi:MAG: glycerophosphodiester phosphodiesterase family protein, partial [Rhizobiaceae bacterium]
MRDLGWLTRRPIAHRGLHDGNKQVWENTLDAFAAAKSRNFTIECDVHLTKDNQVIVFHDGDLKRLTGRDGAVHEHSGDEMRALRIGGTAQHVPTLGQMLDLVDGSVPLVIELKGDAGHDDGLVEALAHGLSGYAGQVAVMSFDHHLIRDFKKHMPDVPSGLTAEGLREADMEAHFSMLAHDIDFVSYNVHHLDNRFVSFVR